MTGRGTLFYRSGQDIFRDTGSHVLVKRDVSDAGIQAALRIAVAKFNGQPLAVNGTEEFKERCVAVAAGLSLTFSDAQMEKARLGLLQPVQVQHTTTRTREQPINRIEIPERIRNENGNNRGMSR